LREFATGHREATERPVYRAPGKLKEVLAGYLARRSADVQAIQSALDAGDYDTIRTAGHRMKGSGGGYGLDRITELGGAIEEAAAASNAELIRQHNHSLEEFLRTVRITYD
jgi:histidine phosphotransfer protein HptB